MTTTKIPRAILITLSCFLFSPKVISLVIRINKTIKTKIPTKIPFTTILLLSWLHFITLDIPPIIPLPSLRSVVSFGFIILFLFKPISCIRFIITGIAVFYYHLSLTIFIILFCWPVFISLFLQVHP